MAVPVKLSFVIPLFNEEATLAPLFQGILKVVEEKALGSFEVVFVDDGSTDGSWAEITALKKAHPDTVRALRFRRNLGKAAALSAGFREVSGEIVVTMDADLQDEPSEVPGLIERMDQGYDVVSGWKQMRRDPLSKTLPSRVFNWATRVASGVRLNDFNCGFKAYRADAVRNLDLYGELHRYIPVLLNANGYSVTEVPVSHNRRSHGASKYGWKRLFKGGLDLVTVLLLTRYLRRPGHFFGGFGLLSGFTGFAILAWLSAQKILFGAAIGNRPLFFLGILLLLLGAQLISTGLIGELINHNTDRHSTLAPDAIRERL